MVNSKINKSILSIAAGVALYAAAIMPASALVAKSAPKPAPAMMDCSKAVIHYDALTGNYWAVC